MSQSNFEDIPDSAYARELRRGQKQLKFALPLEGEYRIAHVRRVRLRVRVWHSLNLLVAVLYAIDSLRRDAAVSLFFVAHVGALVPCCAALAWSAWSPVYERLYLPIAQSLVPISGLLIAIFAAIAVANGRQEELASLSSVLVAAFFFAGLMFRQALFAALAILAAFALAAIAAKVPFVMLLKSMVIMTMTTVIATIIYYDVEKSYRRNFLEDAIIKELVTRDGLTGLMNRRAFDEHLVRVWRLALRDQRSMAVLMIDVDHFKQYNDDFGHPAGDLALRTVAKAIDGFARRPLDLAARYGGEEFAFIFYDLGIPHIHDIAERIRDAVQRLKIQPDQAAPGTEHGVTVSVGVGLVAPSVGRTPEGAVQLADEALYEAKRAGRNCVRVKGTDAYLLLDTGSINAPQISWRHH